MKNVNDNLFKKGYEQQQQQQQKERKSFFEIK